MASKQNLSLVVDLGTSKFVALAGRLTESGKMEILGTTQLPSKGIKRGVVVNIDEAAEALGALIAALENQLEDPIGKIHVVMSGPKMKTVDYQTTSLTSGEGFVTAIDVQRMLEEAKSVEVQQEYRVVRVIPTSYLIDGEHEVEKPVGSTGQKIEANFKLVLVPTPYLNSLKLVFDKIGHELGDIIHAPLAVSEAVLSSEEKEVGAIVMDFGAGTTKLAVFQDNVLRHTAVVPFGGQVVTNDIREGCAIFLKKAELLKCKYGQAMGDFADERKVVTIAGENGWEPRDISFKSLAYIIQARLEEIIEVANTQIEKSGIEGMLGSGIVITGGTARLENMVSLVKFKTGMDAKIAQAVIHPVNRKEEFRNPDLFTALGALKMVLSNVDDTSGPGHRQNDRKKDRGFAPRLRNVVQGALNLFDTESSDAELN